MDCTISPAFSDLWSSEESHGLQNQPAPLRKTEGRIKHPAAKRELGGVATLGDGVLMRPQFTEAEREEERKGKEKNPAVIARVRRGR